MPPEGVFDLGLADDDVKLLVDLNELADRILVGKQHLGRFVADHGDVVDLLQILVAKEPAAGHAQVVHLQILRRATDDPHVGHLVEIAGFLANLAHRHGLLQRGHVGHDAVVVVAQQAVGDDEPAAARDVGRGLGAAHDDVVGAQIFDLLLGLVADALAHRDQPDHGGHADEDAQDGQPRAKLVQQQAFEAQPQGLPEFGSIACASRTSEAARARAVRLARPAISRRDATPSRTAVIGRRYRCRVRRRLGTAARAALLLHLLHAALHLGEFLDVDKPVVVGVDAVEVSSSSAREPLPC